MKECKQTKGNPYAGNGSGVHKGWDTKKDNPKQTKITKGGKDMRG